VFNIGGGEVLVILVVALIFLGPSKLPEIARTLGRTSQAIRSVSESFRSELTSAVDETTESKARQRGIELRQNEILPMVDDSPMRTNSEFELGNETSQQENENT
tara:strand:- start:156 stop:467 length:312 start_codon:yes stop_codon:yes gene_type:complete